MATRVHDVQVRMVADLRDLEAQLAKAPNITDKTARQMTNRFMRQWRKMEQQLKRSNVGNAASASMGQLGSSTDKATQAFRALSIQAPDVFQQLAAGQAPMQVLIQQGGQVAQQFQAMGLAGGILNAVVGPLGVGIAAIGTAAVVVANQTQEARMRLEEYRDVINSSTDATHQLARSQSALKLATGDVAGFVADLEIQAAVLNGTIDKTDLELGKLGNRLADELKPELLEAGKAFAENEARIKKLEEAAGQLGFAEEAKRVAELNEALSARTGLQGNLDAIKGLSLEGREAINAFGEAQRNAAADTDKAKTATKAYKDELREAVALEQARTAALAQLATLRDQAAVATGQATQAEIAYRNTLQEIAALEAEGALQPIEAAQARLAAKQIATEAELDALAKLEENRARFHEQELSRIEKERMERQRATDSIVASSVSMLGSINQLAEQVAEKGGAGAEAAAKAARAAALFGITVNTAEAITKGFAMYGPPPSPAGIAAAAAAAIAGGAQAAAVNAAAAPSFAVGGTIQGPSADSVMVRAHAGEGILTRRGMDTLDQINRGGAMAQTALRAVLRYDHRVFDLGVSETMKRGGRVGREIDRRTGGDRPGHSRRS